MKEHRPPICALVFCIFMTALYALAAITLLVMLLWVFRHGIG